MQNRYLEETERARIGIFIQVLPRIFHKLKNKLTPIMGYTQILMNKCSESATRARLDKIERNALELSELMDRLKNTSPVYTTSMESCSLNELVETALPYLRQEAEPSSIRLESDLTDSPGRNFFDRGQLFVLLSELTSNAVTAIDQKNIRKTRAGSPDPGARIRISTAWDSGADVLRVSDNGSGIAEEVLPKIWTPFFSHFPSGLGLGLLLCEQIAENHRADVHVSSEIGSGTEVSLLFKRDGDD